jgi:hypothetical protein
VPLLPEQAVALCASAVMRDRARLASPLLQPASHTCSPCTTAANPRTRGLRQSQRSCQCFQQLPQRCSAAPARAAAN